MKKIFRNVLFMLTILAGVLLFQTTAYGAEPVQFILSQDEAYKYLINEDGVSCTLCVVCYETREDIVTLPDKIDGFTVTDVADHCVPDAARVVFPKSLKSIDSNNLRNSIILKELELNEGLESIGMLCFNNCSLLESVYFPSSLKVINPGAFSQDVNLSEITGATGLESIIGSAFEGCTSLTEIHLPAIKSIGEHAFKGCIALKSLYLSADLKEIKSGAFSGCNAISDVYFAGTKEQWKEIPKDSEFDEIMIHYESSGPGTGWTDYDRQYVLTLLSSPEGAGTLTGAGSYDYNSFVDITATANPGYKFKGWMDEDGNLYPIVSFEKNMLQDETMTAVFEEQEYACEIGRHKKAMRTDKEISASCEQTGSYELITYCELCNQILSIEEKEEKALGHLWDDGIVTKEAEIGVAGEMTYSCDRCGNTKTEVIPALEVEKTCANGYHAEDVKKVNVVKASCTKAGSYDLVTYCKVCELELNTVHKTVAATGHTWGKAVVTSYPYYGQAGEKTWTCSKCEDTKTAAVAPLVEKKGDVVVNGNYLLKYKILDSKTVSLVGCEAASLKTMVIPATITIGKNKYKVVKIAAASFKNSRFTSVKIGKNVKSIGKNAFANSKKLSKIDIQTNLLTSKTIGASAFSKISSKATITVPAKKYKAYKTLLKKKGINGKNQKMKKK